MTELTARVPCEDETRDKLRSLKNGAERYDDVLNRLIREAGYTENNA